MAKKIKLKMKDVKYKTSGRALLEQADKIACNASEIVRHGDAGNFPVYNVKLNKKTLMIAHIKAMLGIGKEESEE